MKPLLRPALALLLAAVVGCGAPTTSGTPVTPGPHTSTPDPRPPVFDPDPSTIVIEMVAARATIAGPQGTTRVRVYGDGRMERTALDTIGNERLTLADDGVTALIAAADRLGMLSDPDLGDVMITDVGSTSLTIRLQDRTIDLDVIGPGITGVGSPSVERARADFSAFLEQLQSLDGIGIARQPQTIYPHAVAVSASPIRQQPSDHPWPLAAPGRSVFAASSCALVSGGDVQRLAAVLLDQQRRRSSEGGRLSVATGDVGVPALEIRVSSEHPQCTPAPTEQSPLPTLPWPAHDRVRAGQWQQWQADGALAVAADRRTLGLGDPGSLRSYEIRYVAGTVAGAPVVDVIATPDGEHAGRADMPSFAARVDLTPADGPVVTRTVRT